MDEREKARSSPCGDHGKCGHGACVRPKGHTGSHSVHLEGTPFSVPQREDHEKGIEAAADALAACAGFARKYAAQEAVAAYLSRVSPSPERDTEKP